VRRLDQVVVDGDQLHVVLERHRDAPRIGMVGSG
jgi:hypothetical protein